MPIGPITYLSPADLLEVAHTRIQHPLPEALYHWLVAEMADLPDDEARSRTLERLLFDIIQACGRLSEELNPPPHRRSPRLPTDPREQERYWREGVAELVQWWGYQDVTAQVRDWYARDAAAQDKPCLFDYRFVFQSPESVHYVRTLADLLITLDEARQHAAEETHHETAAPREEDEDAPRL